jgi:acetyl/propionyl-CoA carboxylase alpha subunit
MGTVAVRAAEAVGYTNAGTVEFLLGLDGSFYFLEMNTRLQVEHPITELVTGIDIVQQQLRLAAGEPLRYRQADIRPQCHAIECRITAEDPLNGFLPASGRVIRLSAPGGPGVRVDSGIEVGLEVSTYYDSLLSKLVVSGETRTAAIERMARALAEYRIIGLPTSIPFHRWVMGHPVFRQGKYNTGFIQEHLPLARLDQAAHQPIAALVAVLLSHEQQGRARVPSKSGDVAESPSPWSGRSWKMAGRWEILGR